MPNARDWWLTRPALEDLRHTLDQIDEVNPIAADRVQDALEDHAAWLAATPDFRASVYLRHRGYDIHRAAFSRNRRYWRYVFFYLSRTEDVVIIACDHASGDPERIAAHVAGGLRASEPEL